MIYYFLVQQTAEAQKNYWPVCRYAKLNAKASL